jgi:hypothetical protein
MRMHPSHSYGLYKVHQQEREAEARMYHIQQPSRGGSKGRKLIVVLGSFSASVHTAIAPAITSRLGPAGNNQTLRGKPVQSDSA